MEEVGQLLSHCTLNGSVLEYVDSENEIIEGQVVGGADNEGNGNPPENEEPPVEVPAVAAAMANFDATDGTDDAGAMREACQRLEKVQWDPTDILFFFTQIESKMKSLFWVHRRNFKLLH